MRRIEAYTLLATSIAAAITASLALIGESRVDVYVSVAILSHFISVALTGVEVEVKRKAFTTLTIVYIAVFSAIVAFRVMEILYPELLEKILTPGG
ncbi:MAG: hypothetical protein B6U76_08165 [Desulfurococcales archaeon ex4484_217_2]|nr:MAG: hypothetical protein B6U76_08165 [Desulfurococcales archaeon ex4484_217_2]